MSYLNPHLIWVLGYSRQRRGRFPNTHVLEYRMSDLIRTGYINRGEAQEFLQASGLRDFRWEITYPEDFPLPDEMLVERIGSVQGYAVFIHGWTGNAAIWEDLPGMVVDSNRQLVAISLDHNGFGASAFEDDTPPLEACNPPAAMRTVQRWIDLMKLRRQPGSIQHKVINLIGHSMGGATLFYLDPIQWNYGEVTRLAIAPALLLEDESHRLFYTTLGLGIGILQRLPVLEVVERFIKPGMIRVLVAGASEEVKQIHSDQYERTPRGTTGATFMAMGRLSSYEIAREWQSMRVMLGHRDPLVGMTEMIDLLMKLEFPAANLHVVPGSHYMFSVGSESFMNTQQHAQNREMVVNDILDLHTQALELQRKGQLIG